MRAESNVYRQEVYRLEQTNSPKSKEVLKSITHEVTKRYTMWTKILSRYFRSTSSLESVVTPSVIRQK
jgi:hypothetical protein